MMYFFFGGLLLVHCLIGAMLLRAAVVSSNKLFYDDEPLAEPPFGNAFGLMILLYIGAVVCTVMLRLVVSDPTVVLCVSMLLFPIGLFFLILGQETSVKRAAVITALQITYNVLISSVFYGFYKFLT